MLVCTHYVNRGARGHRIQACWHSKAGSCCYKQLPVQAYLWSAAHSSPTAHPPYCINEIGRRRGVEFCDVTRAQEITERAVCQCRKRYGGIDVDNGSVDVLRVVIVRHIITARSQPCARLKLGVSGRSGAGLARNDRKHQLQALTVFGQ